MEESADDIHQHRQSEKHIGARSCEFAAREKSEPETYAHEYEHEHAPDSEPLRIVGKG